MNSRIIVYVMAASLVAVSPAVAASVSMTAGKLTTDPMTAQGIPLSGTGDVCVATVLPGPFIGNAGPGVDCMNEITEGPLQGKYPGKGYLGAKKVPIPQLVMGMKTGAGGNNPDITSSNATAQFETKQPGGMFTQQTVLNTSAVVVRATAKSPADIATAIAKDPLFFSPSGTMPIPLHLVITLTDVNLVATADPGEFVAAQLQASAAFGLGSHPGENILAESAPFFRSVTNNGSLAISSLTLMDVSFQLMPGNTYWLTTELDAGAGTVPEPGSLLLLGTATAFLSTYVWRRRVGVRKRSRTLWVVLDGIY
jgi:hypothetical protein